MNIFQRFMTETCIYLFFTAPYSKLSQLLITMNRAFTNFSKRTMIQMSLYGHLTTSHSRHQTNFYKLSLSLLPLPRLRGDVLSLRAVKGLGERGYVFRTDTNRIQREFLFNNCIQSQKFISYLRCYSENTNFLKPFLRVLWLLRGESILKKRTDRRQSLQAEC
jgi:hypothetical protein